MLSLPLAYLEVLLIKLQFTWLLGLPRYTLDSTNVLFIHNIYIYIWCDMRLGLTTEKLDISLLWLHSFHIYIKNEFFDPKFVGLKLYICSKNYHFINCYLLNFIFLLCFSFKTNIWIFTDRDITFSDFWQECWSIYSNSSSCNNSNNIVMLTVYIILFP